MSQEGNFLSNHLLMNNNFLPNLFILGAAKCGTTTLHAYLSSMPEVCMSNPKEPHFFECEFLKGLDYYRKKYYDHWKGEKIIGEARHRNLYLPFVPERIYQVNPLAKLIVMIRNPIDRAYSHWWHWYSIRREKLSFSDAIKTDFERIKSGFQLNTQEEITKYCDSLDIWGNSIYRTYLDSGYYYEQIKRYTDYFPENRIKVFLLEDLIKKRKETIHELRKFLDLDVLISEDSEAIKLMVSKLSPTSDVLLKVFKYTGLKHILPTSINNILKKTAFFFFKKRPMDKKTRKWLMEHYLEHNINLEKYLYRDLSHWI